MNTTVASNDARFLGTWRLMGVVREEVGSGRKLDTDAQPSGYIAYTPDGRMSVIIHHYAPDHPEQFTCYAAQWHVEGDMVIHAIDITNRPSWRGTRQLRNFRFEGTRLILTPPESEDYTHGTVTRRSLTWEKVGA